MMAMNSQIASILNRMSETFDDFAETRRICVRESPPASYGLRKESLFIKMDKSSTRSDRLLVLNTILSTNEETKFLFMDIVNYKQD